MKTFLFDMDGVLLDSEPGILADNKRILESLGHNVSMEEMHDTVGKAGSDTVRMLINRYNLDITEAELLDRFRERGNYFYGESPNLMPIDGAIDAIRFLFSAGAKIGVVSSTSSPHVLLGLSRFSLIQYISAIVCRDMIKNPKPAPDAYLAAANYLGARAEDCVVIEDSPTGIAAGKAAGMTVVGISASSLEQDISSADIKLYSFSDFIKTVKVKCWI